MWKAREKERGEMDSITLLAPDEVNREEKS